MNKPALPTMHALHRPGILVCVLIFCLAFSFFLLNPDPVQAKKAKDATDPEAAQEEKNRIDPNYIKAELAVVQIKAKVAKLEKQVETLRSKYMSEIEQRDALLLQKRFVEAREYFYKLNDYDGAAEILYGVIHDPAARYMRNYYDALFYLAESLYHIGNYLNAKKYYEQFYAIGPEQEFFGPSMTRLIELAIIEGDYDQAKDYYIDFLKRFPKDRDSSFGTYLIGKAFYMKGDRKKAEQLFNLIPAGSEYSGMAQYFLTVMLVENGKLEEAIEKFNELKFYFKEDVAHKKRLYELIHLSLGRLYYELDDYNRAMNEYYTIPPESEDYAQALYESIWVFITRNDRILQELLRERTRFSSLKYDYGEFLDDMRTEEKRQFFEMREVDILELGEVIDEMDILFQEIEASLGNLMQEAVTAFQKLITTASDSPLVPEAEVLMGNVYAQVDEFEDSAKWFQELKGKYQGYKEQIAQTKSQMVSQEDHVRLIEEVIDTKTGKETEAPAYNLTPDVKNWLAEKPGVRESLQIINRLERQDKALAEMRKMMSEVETALEQAKMESAFPILNSAKKKANGLLVTVGDVSKEFAGVEAKIELVKKEESRWLLLNRLDQEDNRLFEVRQYLEGIEFEVEEKKRKKLDDFRTMYMEVGRPIENFRMDTASLALDSKHVAAKHIHGKLEQVGKLVDTVLLQASLGEIDIAWKRTQKYNKDINEILRQQEEEIRSFRKTLIEASE